MISLGREESELQSLDALWTAREIAQQPAMLLATQEGLANRKAEIAQFLQPFSGGSRAQATERIVLTGAGTSAFVGACLAPHLAALLSRRVEAIATTDLVSAPHLYFERETPTLLVSFARSGNSPESVAAVDLADDLVPNVRHLAITCNGDGALARRQGKGQCLVLTLPEATNDRSFAMTSSFSCMMYAGLAVLSGVEGMPARAARIASATGDVIGNEMQRARALAARRFERVVYLGSQGFKGLAREAALKLLELTDGATVAVSDTPLGFRHGPKTIVNGRTLVVVFLSNHAYTRRYDLDLIEELHRDGRAGGLLVICARDDGLATDVERVAVPGMTAADDVDLLVPYVALPQMLAFEQSIALGCTPDQPNKTGTVNRVVQGVRIHPFAPTAGQATGEPGKAAP